MIHSSWKVYFHFSQKEVKGIIVLGFILFGSILLSILLPSQKASHNEAKSELKYALFYFDPNKIDSLQAIHLGIPSRQVSTLLRYRYKGGYFKDANDFARLYGLSPALQEKLSPYIRIAKYNSNNKALYNWNHTSYLNKRAKMKEDYLDWQIDMNAADALEWQEKTQLPMVMVQHIIQYRNYLGAFTNKSQLGKVYGMPDSIYQLLWKHLRISKKSTFLINANAMQFKDWKELGLFTNQQIGLILKLKKEQGGRIGWREIAEACDLTQEEVNVLKKKVRIDD